MYWNTLADFLLDSFPTSFRLSTMVAKVFCWGESCWGFPFWIFGNIGSCFNLFKSKLNCFVNHCGLCPSSGLSCGTWSSENETLLRPEWWPPSFSPLLQSGRGLPLGRFIVFRKGGGREARTSESVMTPSSSRTLLRSLMTVITPAYVFSSSESTIFSHILYPLSSNKNHLTHTYRIFHNYWNQSQC